MDGNEKLTLALIWHLIQRYSSFGGIKENVFGPQHESTQFGDGVKAEDTSKPPKPQTMASPKSRLLNWIHHTIPTVHITNFAKDWNDGRAIGALVSEFAPGIHTCS